jgi:hypothetical protein
MCRPVSLPVVVYGCQNWLLTLRAKRGLTLFKNRLLRRIFGPKRVEVTGEWRKLHNDKLNNLYSSPTIVQVIKLRRIRWAGSVVRRGEVYRGFWWANLRERYHLGDPGVDGRIILRWNLRKCYVGVWIGSMIGTSVPCSKYVSIISIIFIKIHISLGTDIEFNSYRSFICVLHISAST